MLLLRKRETKKETSGIGSAGTIQVFEMSTESVHFFAAAVCAIFFFVIFEDVVIYTILKRSLISGDDAFFAMVSKALAFDGVYGLPLSSSQISIFEPTIGTGPALIIPGALMIRIFGAQFWVPGVTAHVLFLLQATALFAVLAKPYGLARSLAFVTAVIALMQAMSGLCWYFPSFLGEVPAFGHLLLGAGLLSTGLAARRLASAGIFFGLAFLTKQITLFAGAGVVMAWGLLAYRNLGLRSFARASASLTLGALIPLALFEVYKVVTLGTGGYADLFKRQVAASIKYGVDDEGVIEGRFGRFIDIVVNGYLADWWTVVFITVSAVFAVIIGVRSRDARVRLRFAIFMWAGSITFLVYYLLFAPTYARYLAIGVYAVAAALAAPFLAFDLRCSALYALCLYLFMISGLSLDHGFRSLPATRAQQAEAVQTIEALPDYPIVGRSWHSLFDVIYLLDQEREWVVATQIERLQGQAFLFVAQMPFAPSDDDFMRQISAKCRQIPLQGERYQVRVCGYAFWNNL